MNLLAIYDVMMSKPLWQRRNGSDFAFFQVGAEPCFWQSWRSWRLTPISCVLCLGQQQWQPRIAGDGRSVPHSVLLHAQAHTGFAIGELGYRYETTLCESFASSLHFVNVLAQRYKCAYCSHLESV